MKTGKISNTNNGWFIGDFPNAVFNSKDFEVCWRIHKKNEFWDLHYQKKSIEINLLIDGDLVLNNQQFTSGDIFILYPYEITDVKFLTDCSIVCIKTPSLPNDKVKVFIDD